MKTSRRDVNEILCPHCDKNIALEEGAFGLFECPHCDEEFSWDSDSKSTTDNIIKITNIVGATVFGIGLIGFVFSIIWLSISDDWDAFGSIFVFFWVMLIGISILLAAVMMWGFNKLIPRDGQTTPPEVIISFGLVVFAIFCIIIFYFFLVVSEI